jgi:dipeptidyl aminopeptidase/acylaminoacyl peptidase
MKALSMDTFTSYQFLSGLRRGPEGDLAFLGAKANVEANSYDRDLWVKPKEGDAFQLTTDGKTGGFLWDGAHTLLFASSRDPEQKKHLEAGEEYTTFYRLDLRGGEAKKAFSVPLSASLEEKVGDGLYLLRVDWDLRFSKAYTMKGAAKEELLKEKKEEKDYQVLDELPFYFNGQGYVNKHRDALFLYNETTDKLTRITKETFAVGSAHLSPDGTKVVFTGQNFTVKRKEKSGIYVYDLVSGKTTQLLAPRVYEVYDALWWGEKILALATDQKRYGINENVQFYILDPATGDMSLLAPYEDAVASSVGSDCRLGGGESWLVSDGKFYFIATIRNASQVFCLEESGEIRPVYTQEGSVDCLDVADGTLYFIGMQDMKLQEIYAWDEAKQERTQLTSLNQKVLEDVYVAMPQKLTFENDNTDLDGWVLLPKDFDPQQSYPGILDIHGGPKTVYGEVFYHEMQFWANQGYFVFFCNPRGGDGRGNEFADLKGKYGTIDYSDLMAFTDKVLEKYPQIDKTRLCVTGGSYGGFMTNWIVGHTDRFCAAATQRSITNWVGFGFTSDIGEEFARDQMGLGLKDNVWNSMEKMWFHSPLKYLDQCVTPTLVIHSDEDYRCPISEGYQIYSALQQRGVETRMVIFHGENHELSRSGKPRHRIRRLKEITGWFEKHI